MPDAPLIWAIDQSKRRTGFAWGRAGDKPAAFSIVGEAGEPSRRSRMRLYLALHGELKRQGRPAVIYHEKLIPGGMFEPKVDWEKKTVEKRFGSGAQFDLAGMVAAIELFADLAEIPSGSVAPATVRVSFLGNGRLKRAVAKRQALAMCRLLFWQAANDDEAEALAIWHHATCVEAPRLAAMIHPGMFAKAASLASNLPRVFEPVNDEVAW